MKKPSLKELGMDLCEVSGASRVFSLLIPFVFLGAFFLFASREIWVVALFCVVGLSFVTYGSTSHDLVHRNLGLSRQWNDRFLFLIELLCLRSGTAYRLAHLNHHRVFPSPKDVEAFPASQSLGRCLLDGFVAQFRIWGWALKQEGANKTALWTEAVFIVGYLLFAAWNFSSQPMFAVYGFLVIGGSWFFPLITVYLPHDIRHENLLMHTRVFRGRVLHFLFFAHLYHIEHHLYPMVPHHHWPALARRLDPFFERVGVPVIRIPSV